SILQSSLPCAAPHPSNGRLGGEASKTRISGAGAAVTQIFGAERGARAAGDKFRFLQEAAHAGLSAIRTASTRGSIQRPVMTLRSARTHAGASSHTPFSAAPTAAGQPRFHAGAASIDQRSARPTWAESASLILSPRQRVAAEALARLESRVELAHALLSTMVHRSRGVRHAVAKSAALLEEAQFAAGIARELAAAD